MRCLEAALASPTIPPETLPRSSTLLSLWSMTTSTCQYSQLPLPPLLPSHIHVPSQVRSLEAALASPTIPPETVTALLNLAEFMEHDDKRLPLDTRTLGALAEKCHAFAKALHYKVWVDRG